VRIGLHWFVTRPFFDGFIMFVILLSSVALALEDPVKAGRAARSPGYGRAYIPQPGLWQSRPKPGLRQSLYRSPGYGRAARSPGYGRANIPQPGLWQSRPQPGLRQSLYRSTIHFNHHCVNPGKTFLRDYKLCFSLLSPHAKRLPALVQQFYCSAHLLLHTRVWRMEMEM
jgi:hypothetical protein